MNFNYSLPGGGKGSRIFGGDHMVFRGTRRGGQSSLTEYEGGTFRKLKANGGIIRKLQSVWGGAGKFFGSKKNTQTPVPLPYAINHARSLKNVEIFNT